LLEELDFWGDGIAAVELGIGLGLPTPAEDEDALVNKGALLLADGDGKACGVLLAVLVVDGGRACGVTVVVPLTGTVLRFGGAVAEASMLALMLAKAALAAADAVAFTEVEVDVLTAVDVNESEEVVR
jgi:hypothetical protein